MRILQHCFYQMSHVKSENTGTVVKLQWLVELLGHARNLLNTWIDAQEDGDKLSRVCVFCSSKQFYCVCAIVSK